MPRSDVGSTYGSRFTNSGYSLVTSALTTGNYQLIVFARRTVSGVFDVAATVNVAVDFPVAAPTINPPSGPYVGPTTISLSSATPQAVVRYTLNGSDPTASSPIGTAFLLAGSGTVKAKAFRTGFVPSATSSAAYTLQLAPPVLTPPPGSYEYPAAVSVSIVEQAANIYYTTDGSDPTQASTLYTGSFALPETPAGVTVKARAFRSGSDPSVVVGGYYTLRAATPVISPSGGSFDQLPLVAISTSTPGAVIHYTTDRSEPTINSPIFSAGSISVSHDTSVKAVAFKPTLAPSLVRTETFVSNLAPSSEPSPGTATPNISATVPNAVGGNISFEIAGASLSTVPGDIAIFRNGVRLENAGLQLQEYQPSGGNLLAPGVLQDGLNDIELQAFDTAGLLLTSQVRAWAGNRTMTIWATDRQYQPIPGATVIVTLVDDGRVRVSLTTDGSGSATFTNLPTNASTEVAVSAAGFRPWTFVSPPAASMWTVPLDAANNDFSQSFYGWSVSTVLADFLPHSETSYGWVPCPQCVIRPQAEAGQQLEAINPPAAAPIDWDVRIQTMNAYGAQTISRRFYVAPGTMNVSVRYRFQTAEVSAASPQNDWYAVTIRSLNSGQQVQDVRSVFSFWGHYDQRWATDWMTLTLPITPTLLNDEVELTFSVANAYDNAYISMLWVDFIDAPEVKIAQADLRDLIDPSDPYAASRPIISKTLSAFSASPQSAYDGYIRINGSIKITGPAYASLQNIWVDVLENGEVKATGELARSSASPIRSLLLNQPLGADGEISVVPTSTGITPLLFEIPSGQFSSVTQTTNGFLRLRLRAQLTTGYTLPPFEVYAILPKLVLYTGTNRYGTLPDPRDLITCQGLSISASSPYNNPPFPCGGDSWATPVARTFASGVQFVSWGDFSNMHGGFFPPHALHQTGLDMDGYFDGYEHKDGAAAAKMLAYLQLYGKKIDTVFVAYPPEDVPSNKNGFWLAIKDVVLPDGRRATSVIRPERTHTTHFHWRLNPALLP